MFRQNIMLNDYLNRNQRPIEGALRGTPEAPLKGWVELPSIPSAAGDTGGRRFTAPPYERKLTLSDVERAYLIGKDYGDQTAKQYELQEKGLSRLVEERKARAQELTPIEGLPGTTGKIFLPSEKQDQLNALFESKAPFSKIVEF